jgi:hypothetical protein
MVWALSHGSEIVSSRGKMAPSKTPKPPKLLPHPRKPDLTAARYFWQICQRLNFITEY